MKGLSGFIVRRGVLMAVLSLISLVPAIWFLPRARIDNSLEVWMGRRGPELARYEAFLQRYGSDEMIVIAVEMPDPSSPSAITAQRDLATELRAIQGIREVTSLPDVHVGILARSSDGTTELWAHPLIRNLLLTKDGKTVGMVAWLHRPAGPEARQRVVDAVRQATDRFETRGYPVHLAGAPVLNVELDRASSREVARLMPLAAALSIGMLLMLFRSLLVPLICLAAIATAIVWTLAAMVISGTTLNLISISLPALLTVLALSPGAHIAVRYSSKLANGQPAMDAMRAALSELLMPLLLTTITTAIGFASLLITDMQPVFEVGLFALIGMLLSLVFTLAIVPGLLSVLPLEVGFRSTTQWTEIHWTSLAAGWAARKARMVVLASLLLVPVLALISLRIHTETNVLGFLPAHSKVATDYEFVRTRLTGLYTLEMDISVPAASEEATVTALCNLDEALSRHLHVARVDSFGEFMPLLAPGAAMSFLPESLDPVRRAAAHFRVVDDGIVHLRASVMVRSMASSDFEDVIDTVRREASARLPQTAAWDLTGAVLLMSHAQEALVRTQVRSFAIAAALVLLVIGMLMRSGKVVIASVVPNLLPVLTMFALMAVLGLTLNPATVMIASVAIGLAVDSTIHFLSCYRDALRTDGISAAIAAMGVSGRPIVYTTLVAAAGFAMLVMAEFAPLREFGLLTGVTLIVAMLCDVFITPAWAVMLRLWEGPDAATGR